MKISSLTSSAGREKPVCEANRFDFGIRAQLTLSRGPVGLTKWITWPAQDWAQTKLLRPSLMDMCAAIMDTGFLCPVSLPTRKLHWHYNRVSPVRLLSCVVLLIVVCFLLRSIKNSFVSKAYKRYDKVFAAHCMWGDGGCTLTPLIWLGNWEDGSFNSPPATRQIQLTWFSWQSLIILIECTSI